MLNRVVLVGRLTRDPDFRTSQSGVSVANFTLAVNRTFTNAQGEREADFINCVVFRRQAENVNTYLSKGSLAGVDGRLQSRSYDNKEGQRVYVTEVVCDSVQFLEPKGSNNNSNQSNSGQYNTNYNNNYNNGNNNYNNNYNNQNNAFNQNKPNNNAPVQNPFKDLEQANNSNNNFSASNQNSGGPVDLADDDLPF